MVGELTLRPISEDDFPTLFEFQRDTVANRIAAFTSRDPNDRNAFDSHWKKIVADESITYRAVEVNDRLVGSVGCYTDPKFASIEVTYWIDRQFWGQGYATAALQKLLEIETRRPVYGRAALDNHGSRRVLEKCGFRFLKNDLSFANARGANIEEVVMVLTR